MIKLGNSYRLYGKIGNMKRVKPVAGSRFVTNLIYAEIYTPRNQEDVIKMKREIEYLNKQGQFEFKAID